jgi:two-component system sensor histidine kinase BaeS
VTAERRTRRSPLTARLTGAFVLVAVSAVVVLSVLTLWRTKHTVGRLADERQQATAESIAETLALAYRQQGGWPGVDVHPAVMIALQADAAVAVHDMAGDEVALYNSMPSMPGMSEMPAMAHDEGRAVTAEVVVDGQRVGVAEVTFANSELASAERHVRDALSGTVVLGALAAAAIAALVAVPLSRRIIRPLQTVTHTARLVGDGDPTARVGHHGAPGELGELARAFDDMAERLEATESARRNVVTDLAHELRTPLTILQGTCEEIIDGIAEPTLERFVHMHDDLLRLRRLVDDLNTLADADAARTEQGLRQEPCDLADIAADVAADLAAVIDVHHHELTLALSPARTAGDPARLHQIVTNLLTNAIKYTPAGGRIEIRTSTDDAGRTVNLRVTDNGPGIDPADRLHVFERFYRATSAQTTSGTGIGLAVVDQLVRAHGGVVRIVDGGTGATIEVELPGSPSDQTPSFSRT